MGKDLTKFVKFANNFTKFVGLANNLMKFPEAANRYKKLPEVRKNFGKFQKFPSNLTNLWDLQKTYMKFIKAANNFTKFIRLANSFWEGFKTRKNSIKFADWKAGFKCLKVFLYLCFTCSNILFGKHKCFVNIFHVSGILFTNKLNSGCYIQKGKIFGTVKKWWLVVLDRWSFYAV